MANIRLINRSIHLLVLLALLWAVTPVQAQDQAPAPLLPTPTFTPVAAPVAPTPESKTDDYLEAQVEQLLAAMSPADRVGQLFIVTFEGSDITYDSDIVELIHAYRVGGVVISPRNLNFSNEKGVNTPEEVARLTNQLQSLAYGILLPSASALDPMPVAPWPPRDLTYLPAETSVPPSDIPLFIGVEQLGDNLPGTALRRGFTPLPSQMALGASWNPDLVSQVGAVVGRELHAVGINLLLGPSLDVFDQPDVAEAGNLGIFSFGGDPYWVSQLGRAYISGVHNGSHGGVATVARHFPGQGNADRPPDEEVATIQKSLDEMRRTALPPFVAVTRSPSSVLAPDGDDGATDMIMTSHMRYSAFQGGAAGRITPISLAPELRTVLSQAGLDAWHDRGGVVMSNALGVPAIRRFYGAATQDFFSRRVAVDAFMAGNDLLYLADFSLDNNWETQTANIKQTIGYFQDRYRNDADFANRVNQSVRRILRLKLGMYRDSIGALDTPIGTPAGFPPVPATVTATVTAMVTATELPATTTASLATTMPSATLTSPLPTVLAVTPTFTPTFAATGTATVTPTAALSPTASLPLATPTATPGAPPRTGPPLIPLSNVLASDTSLKVLTGEQRAQAEDLMGQVARAAMTILYPDPATQTEPLPPTFRTDDHILIFSDSRLQRECDTCTAEAAIGPDALAETIKRLYGSEATGQIDPELVTSLTFADLTMFLDAQQTTPVTTTSGPTTTLDSTPSPMAMLVPTPTIAAPDVEGPMPGTFTGSAQDRVAKTAALIQQADWIIFAMLNVEPKVYPSSDAVGRFLREYDGELSDQRLVVLSMNAPYFLDATEMSRLTTYFGVYSKVESFLDSAVRALFRAYTVAGAPPVAVPGTRFASLNERLSADPARTMPLKVETNDGALLAENTPTADGSVPVQPALDVGATIRLTVGPIIDHNGHTVPDGAVVNFQLQYEGEVLALAVDPALTRSGMATRDVVVERSGTLRVIANAGQASTGDALAVVIAPPTPTPAPAPSAAAAGPQPGDATQRLPERVNAVTLVIALFTILVTLSLFLIVQVRVLPRATLVHNMLWAAIFGLVGYVLYGLGLFPGANWLRANVSVWGTTVVVFVPMLLPLLWLQLREEK